MKINNFNQYQLSKILKEKAKEEGFEPVGIARVPGSSRIKLRTAALERWLEAGNYADMNWMNAPRRKNIETLLEGISSVVAVGLNYYVDKEQNPETMQIARFAWGNDYHKVIERKLKRIGKWLKKERPDCNWKVCVDSTSLLEKAWAEEAGIGWIGKHSNVINSKNGSWIVLGFLLCTEPLTPDEPAKPLCGKCEKCIDACPTNAITEPFVINANKCITYHNIENRNLNLPKEIVDSMGNWIAGCDICQNICPWNTKEIESSKDPEMQPKEWIMNLTNQQIFNWSDEDWKQILVGSTLKRVKPWMWRRNANAIKEKEEN
ncbi:tRNA epoxyqueuosine(34) reductase QueG [Prochlorococcus sp. MIT 1223]|uniref:tRNA epoxyqueuosine(34) reductase QueG n=1 Tax=Prochlorococcus sp. MIT 1223 TaxID=3096217 RepID=UPI002A74A93A|nr:tRNA epoxyqueuosine(34) reductase QueG [Prochlorococcus sp. MIT 1223]